MNNNNDDDYDYESDVSSLDTHFQERDGDEDNLWEVEAIVAERGRRYQVRWAGVDDKGAPWPLDWVPKEDCTDPLVRKWKKTKARKRKRDEKTSSSSSSSSSSPRKKQKLRVTSPGLVLCTNNNPHALPLSSKVKVVREEDESSIDQFDSPKKSHRPRPRLGLTICEERTDSASTDRAQLQLQLLPAAAAATDVITKGIALAAKHASHQNGSTSTSTTRPSKRLLPVFLKKEKEKEKMEKRRRRSSSSSLELVEIEVGEDQRIEVSEENRRIEVSMSELSPVHALEEFADSFVDYEGGGGGGGVLSKSSALSISSVSPKSNVSPKSTSSRTMTRTLDKTQTQYQVVSPRISRREEEEEDTQDLMAEAELSSPAIQHVASPLRREEEDTRDVVAGVESSSTSVPVDLVVSSDSQVVVLSDEEEDEGPVNGINSPEIAPTVKKNSFFQIFLCYAYMNLQPSSGLEVEQKESVQLHLDTGRPDSVRARSPSPSGLDDMLVVPATMSPSRLSEQKKIMVQSSTAVRAFLAPLLPC